MTDEVFHDVPVFTHPYPYAAGQRCEICGGEATHKVAEVTEDPRHEFTAYVCCECFGRIMGPVAQRWCANAAGP